MKSIKICRALFIIAAMLSVLFIVIYFTLQYQASVCDPVYEIKRHDALIVAANGFLYAFFSALAVSAATGGTLLVIKLKNR